MLNNNSANAILHARSNLKYEQNYTFVVYFTAPTPHTHTLPQFAN